MKKLSIVMLMCLLVLGGCSSSSSSDDNKNVVSTKPVEDDGYRIAIPFNESDATQTHVTFNRSAYDVQAAGEGLVRYSKEYFSTSSYYLQDGQLLTRDILQTNTYYGDQEGLLGFKSDDNPYGLNPEKDSTIPVSGDTSAKVGSSTYPIVDIFEYNFVSEVSSDAEIKGISLGIVLNPNVKDADGKEITISDSNLEVIGEEAARNLVSYLQSLPQVTNKTPIMVGLFKADSEDDTLPGTYFAVGYGKSSIDQFHSVNESWALIPSDSASSIDPTIVSQFNAVKTSLHNFLPNDVSIIGKGFYIDEQLTSLEINVKTQAKTYAENLSVVQYVDSLLSNFSGTGYSIVIKFSSNTETYAMISRNQGSSDTTIIMN